MNGANYPIQPDKSNKYFLLVNLTITSHIQRTQKTLVVRQITLNLMLSSKNSGQYNTQKQLNNIHTNYDKPGQQSEHLQCQINQPTPQMQNKLATPSWQKNHSIFSVKYFRPRVTFMSNARPSILKWRELKVLVWSDIFATCWWIDIYSGEKDSDNQGKAAQAWLQLKAEKEIWKVIPRKL